MSSPFVRSTPRLWQLYNLAKTWGCRPSELLNLSSDFDAYCLDNAVATFGNHLSAELESVEGKNKREMERKREAILRRYIPQQAKARKFKDPGKR